MTCSPRSRSPRWRRERVELTPSVAVAFPRSPTVLASQAWDLQANSRGRFVLGLGSQVKGHNERRFGIAWTAPAPRLRDYVRALRAIWRCWETRGKLDFHSEHYTLTLMTPDFSPEPTGLPMVPVTIAAVGEAMLRVAGQVADGVRLHPLCSRRYLEEVCLPQIADRHAARRPRARELRRARRRVRRHRPGRCDGGRRHGGRAPPHRLLRLDAHLHADPGAARPGGPWAEAAPDVGGRGAGTRWRREVPDDVVRIFAACGTYARDRRRDRAALRRRGGCNRPGFPARRAAGPAARSWSPTSAASRIASPASTPTGSQPPPAWQTAPAKGARHAGSHGTRIPERPARTGARGLAAAASASRTSPRIRGSPAAPARSPSLYDMQCDPKLRER